MPSPVPAQLLAPKDVAELTRLLAQASRDGQPIIPVGRAPSLPETAASQPATILSLEHLKTPIDHRAGDLTATLPAGAVLSEVNAVLMRGGQWLPLDPPFASLQTIGAIVATNDSGPRRLRHGSPRDLIIGIELALADGRLAKAGGHVVKNVAGYDLARMMCGSFGSLAVITSATFKLAPIAPASRTVIADIPDLESLTAVLSDIGEAPVAPSALELEGPPGRLFVRFETTAASADQQCSMICNLASRRRASTTIVSGEREESTWRIYEERIWHGTGTLLKLSVLPTHTIPLLEAVDRLASAPGVAYHVGGRAALGVIYIRFENPAAYHADLVNGVRQHAASVGGSAVIIRAAAEVLVAADRWGDIGDTRALQQAVKQRFDPKGILNPGGGPGGL